jgi:hypothetical protein
MAKVKELATAEVEAEARTEWTMSVPAAGRKYYNLGKFASYQNAGPVGTDALIPTVRAGRLLRALPRLIEKRLAGSND